MLYKCQYVIYEWYLWITSPASIEKGSEEYTENIVTKVSRTTLVLVKSVPVHSMKTFFVFSVILLWSPLIIGGIDKTTPLESYMTGYTGLSFIICRYCFIWLSVWKVETMHYPKCVLIQANYLHANYKFNIKIVFNLCMQK